MCLHNCVEKKNILFSSSAITFILHSYSPSEHVNCLNSLALTSSSPPPPLSHPITPSLTQTIYPIALFDSTNMESKPTSSSATSMMCATASSCVGAHVSLDFLDMMDRGGENSELSCQLDEERKLSRWLPTPDRPRMFPHKLY